MYFGRHKETGDYTFYSISGFLEDETKISDEEYEEFIRSGCGYIIKGDDGKPKYIQKLCDPSIEYRLQERMYLHRNTDDDFAKYSRNIRLGIDVEYSQSVLNYIDQYNQQVSETVNQEGFPQEVVYPEYKIPEKPINT